MQQLRWFWWKVFLRVVLVGKKFLRVKKGKMKVAKAKGAKMSVNNFLFLYPVLKGGKKLTPLTPPETHVAGHC